MIPFIFGGIAALSGIVAFQVDQYCLRVACDPWWAVFVWVVCCALIGFVFGFLVVRTLLRPVENFVQETQNLGVLHSPQEPTEQSPSAGSPPEDEIGRISRVFEQVTEVLSRVEARSRFPEIIGESRAIRGILSRVAKVAPTDTLVLILGESGTGKELVANATHTHSHRKKRPFIKLNCAAIPEGLLESELFGYEKGAFTGADTPKKGKFEAADGGTLFLDEIGDMALATQAKILRVLQDGEFQRVGGNTLQHCNVRLIVATNKDLDEMVKNGTFREDLLYRIKVFTLSLPPLRERKEDITFLAQFFAQSASSSGQNLDISPDAMQALVSHAWPGNIRELKNVMERAAVLCEGETIELGQLPAEIVGAFGGLPPAADGEDAEEGAGEEAFTIDDKLRQIEKSMVTAALLQTNGVQVKAAERLGITQRSLWHRVKKLDIDVRSIKSNNF